MTLIDSLNLIRKQLLTESTLTALVKERVYLGDLKKQLDETDSVNYPCVTMVYQGGEFAIEQAQEYSENSMTFSIFSDDSWEECHTVWNVLTLLLYKQRFYDTISRVIFEPVSQPVFLVDKTGDNDIYYLSIVYRLKIIQE